MEALLENEAIPKVQKEQVEIILVDDDHINLYLHELMIKKYSLSQSPISFEGGFQALEYLKEQIDEPKEYLILLDINMPVMNGWQFLDMLINHPISKHCKVVMLSSSVDPRDHERTELYSIVHEYMEKPFSALQIERLKSMVVNF